jgi:hypothetical protein
MTPDAKAELLAVLQTLNSASQINTSVETALGEEIPESVETDSWVNSLLESLEIERTAENIVEATQALQEIAGSPDAARAITEIPFAALDLCDERGNSLMEGIRKIGLTHRGKAVEVQSFLFPKDQHNMAGIQTWLRERDYDARFMPTKDDRAKHFHMRMAEPSEFDPLTFRKVRFRENVWAVVGRKKPIKEDVEVYSVVPDYELTLSKCAAFALSENSMTALGGNKVATKSGEVLQFYPLLGKARRIDEAIHVTIPQNIVVPKISPVTGKHNPNGGWEVSHWSATPGDFTHDKLYQQTGIINLLLHKSDHEPEVIEKAAKRIVDYLMDFKHKGFITVQHPKKHGASWKVYWRDIFYGKPAKMDTGEHAEDSHIDPGSWFEYTIDAIINPHHQTLRKHNTEQVRHDSAVVVGGATIGVEIKLASDTRDFTKLAANAPWNQNYEISEIIFRSNGHGVITIEAVIASTLRLATVEIKRESASKRDRDSTSDTHIIAPNGDPYRMVRILKQNKGEKVVLAQITPSSSSVTIHKIPRHKITTPTGKWSKVAMGGVGKDVIASVRAAVKLPTKTDNEKLKVHTVGKINVLAKKLAKKESIDLVPGLLLEYYNYPSAEEKENSNDMFDNIIRSLVLLQSMDSLQDVEFEDDFGGVYLYFDGSIPKEEAEMVRDYLERKYNGTQIIASPDKSIPDETTAADWWIVYVPKKQEVLTPNEQLQQQQNMPQDATMTAKNRVEADNPASYAQNSGVYGAQNTAMALAGDVDVNAAIDAVMRGESVETLVSTITESDSVKKSDDAASKHHELMKQHEKSDPEKAKMHALAFRYLAHSANAESMVHDRASHDQHMGKAQSAFIDLHMLHKKSGMQTKLLDFIHHRS